MRRWLLSMASIVLLAACHRQPEPRFPVMHTYHHDYSRSIVFNKARYQAEQKIFDSIVRADTAHHYLTTGTGMRYYYLRRADTTLPHPKPDDLVRVRYGIYYLLGDTIYTPEELGVKLYRVDKEEYFMGFREAVKLLRPGEEAVFLVPSYAGYGLLGDGDRIPGNTPLRLYVQLLEIEPKKINKQ